MHSVSLSISVGSRAPCLVWEGGCKLDRQSVADLACAIDGARDIVMASSASIIFFFNVVCVKLCAAPSVMAYRSIFPLSLEQPQFLCNFLQFYHMSLSSQSDILFEPLTQEVEGSGRISGE
jgi:hypothetical protein